MTGPNRSNRHHLRSVPGAFPFPDPVPRPPSTAELAARIVAAAQAWTAEVLASPLALDPRSREGMLRLALLDAVHDLEFHSAYPGESGQVLPLGFDDGPGTA